jgi:hypothetical protein
MRKGKWRYFVILSKSNGCVVDALSYRDAENPNGDVDPADRSWFRELFERFPQSHFLWEVVEMPAGTSPYTHPKELQEALKHPLISDTWLSNDEVGGVGVGE